MIRLALLAALVTPMIPPQAEPARPAIERQSAKAGKVTIHYLTIPWGPNTFAAMEKGGDSFYAKRTWPFARMETRAWVTIEGTRVPTGNYALVFHPNTADNKGMTFEVRKIRVAEFLEPGNVMTRTPEGETVVKVPIQFDTVEETVPALSIDLAPAKGGASLVIRYGDRQLTRTLAF